MNTPATPQTKNWLARNWLWALPVGCFGMIALTLACIVAAILVFFHLLQQNDVCKEALLRVRSTQQLIEALGEPIEPGWYVSGSIKSDKNFGRADLSMPLSGPKGKGTLSMRAGKHNGVWSFSHLSVLLEDGRRFDLLSGRMTREGTGAAKENGAGLAPFAVAGAAAGGA